MKFAVRLVCFEVTRNIWGTCNTIFGKSSITRLTGGILITVWKNLVRLDVTRHSWGILEQLLDLLFMVFYGGHERTVFSYWLQLVLFLLQGAHGE